MKNVLLVTALGLLAAATASSGAMITFDPRPAGDPLDGGLVRIGGYTEAGMVFEASPEPGSIIVEDSGGIPSNGTAFLSKCGVCRPSLRSVDDGLFDLVSVDLGELLFFGFGSFATAATITDFKQDGSTVVAGLQKPTLTISPASGSYVTSQAFAGVLAECTIDGSLDSVPGATFRCPLDAALLGTGTHTFDVTVELDDGTNTSDSATWEIFGNSEP